MDAEVFNFQLLWTAGECTLVWFWFNLLVVGLVK